MVVRGTDVHRAHTGGADPVRVSSNGEPPGAHGMNSLKQNLRRRSSLGNKEFDQVCGSVLAGWWWWTAVAPAQCAARRRRCFPRSSGLVTADAPSHATSAARWPDTHSARRRAGHELAPTRALHPRPVVLKPRRSFLFILGEWVGGAAGSFPSWFSNNVTGGRLAGRMCSLAIVSAAVAAPETIRWCHAHW